MQHPPGSHRDFRGQRFEHPAPQHASSGPADATRHGVDLRSECRPPSRGRKLGETLGAVRYHHVAFVAVHEDANALLVAFPGETPRHGQSGQDGGFVRVPQYTFWSLQGAEQLDLYLMRFEPPSGEDRVYEGTLVALRRLLVHGRERVEAPSSTFFGEKVPRYARHGRGVEAAAQFGTHRKSTPQATPYRLGEHLVEGLGVLLVRAEPQLARGVQGPVGRGRGLLTTNDHAVGWGQARDLLIEGRGLL